MFSDNEEANVLNSEEILECTDQPTTNISLKDIPNELIMEEGEEDNSDFIGYDIVQQTDVVMNEHLNKMKNM